eukprot:10106680-Alexandrium_andersonii.AAC.1
MTTSAPMCSRATNNMTSNVCATMNCMLARGGQRTAAAHPTTTASAPPYAPRPSTLSQGPR